MATRTSGTVSAVAYAYVDIVELLSMYVCVVVVVVILTGNDVLPSTSLLITAIFCQMMAFGSGFRAAAFDSPGILNKVCCPHTSPLRSYFILTSLIIA